MKPKYIKKNDTISLVAPSFGCTTSPYKERLAASINVLKKKGYNVAIGDNVYLNQGIVSSNLPKSRAKEFMDAYSSDSKIIWSVGGGETMLEILPYIDFAKIKKLEPKWFIGYSDNTVLTYTLTTIANVETIYGICAPSLFDTKSQEVADMLSIIKGKKEFVGYPYYESCDIEHKEALEPLTLNRNKTIIPFNYNGPFSGILIGGCLDILQYICGTKYDNTKKYTTGHKNIIFFFEACDLNSIDIRRTLFHLKEANWFNNVRGFIIGRSLQSNSFFNELPEKSYIDLLKEYNVPILLNVDIGHLHPTLPIICGHEALISYEDSNIKITYK